MTRAILPTRFWIRATLTVVFAFLVVVAKPSRCEAEPLRVLVAVGHRYGLSNELPLKHAGRDATRVSDVFVRLGGVRPEHAAVLQEPNAAQLFATIDRLAGVVKGRPREEVSLVFYFSGHGDREAIHLGSERVLLRDLDSKLAVIPAALRIIVADACRTADTRGKGVSAEDAFAITLDAGRDASGVVRVHASADGEIAQESDELGGAIFTHYWLSGLAGAADTDGDARITFSESYAFAYNQTLFRSARASGVVQRPALEANVREGAPIILTRMASTSAIRFPRTANGHYILYGIGSRTIAGELWSSPTQNVALAMPPGKYIVHRRAGGRSAALALDLGKDEQREIRAADFQALPEEVLARKGGEIILHPNELSLGYGARTSRLYDVGHELSLRYRYGWDSLALGVSAIAGTGGRAQTDQHTRIGWVGAEAIAEARAQLGGVILRAGGGPRVLAMLQTIARTDADRLILAGYDPERTFRGAAFGAHALAGVRVPIVSRTWIDLDVQGDLLGVPVGGSLAASWSAGLGASLGFSF
jgi:hypothetical protein